MKTVLLSLILLCGVLATDSAAAPPLRWKKTYVPKTSQPAPKIPMPTAPALPSSTDDMFVPGPEPHTYGHAVLHENDSTKPSVWGVIVASSEQGWYGVHVKSSMCVAYNQTASQVVAVDDSKCEKQLELGTGVFMRHDHKTGRWHIMFRADKIGKVYGPFEPESVQVQNLPDAPPLPADAVPPPPPPVPGLTT